MKKQNQLLKDINESIQIKKNLLKLESPINKAINKIYVTLKSGGKVFICGNGGSAADAQHLSAEFLVRLNPDKDRRPLPIISLAMDTSTLTACGNDYGFQYIFSRNLQALAKKKDLLITISTSGNSRNIFEVLKLSKKMKIFSIAFLGCKGGKAKKMSNLNLLVPHFNVARIQESHIFLGHFILNRVEEMLFFNKKVSRRKKITTESI
jgi:D-sedoheptulose 7-phosphate isomerase